MIAFLMVFGQSARAEEKLTIAAAADLKFALDEIVVLFKHAHPAAQIETIYGSSGNFSTQIRQGAPYDLYFSADICLPASTQGGRFCRIRSTTLRRGTHRAMEPVARCQQDDLD